MLRRSHAPLVLLALFVVGGLGAAAGAEPPPHAPAHGYRHKHPDGVELVFDARLGLYALAERARHFFHEGAFFRFHEGRWQRAPRAGGPWERVRAKGLPGPIRHLAEERGLGPAEAKPGKGRRGPPRSKGRKGPKGKGRGPGGKGPPGR